MIDDRALGTRARRLWRIPRWARHTLLMVGVLVMSLTVAAAPAHADAIVAQDTMLRNWAAGVCLDSNYNGAAYAIGCNFGTYQVWYTGGTGINVSSGNVNHPVIILRDEQTGRCLDSNAGGSVYTNPCWDGDGYQYWIWWGDNYIGQYQNYNTGLCLTTNVSALYTQTCGSTGYQDWRQGY